MDKHCYGCGVILQDKDMNKPGYVSDINKEEHVLCQRCFKMKNYNQYHSHYMEAKDFTSLLAKTIKPKNLVVLVVDLTDINASFSKNILNIIKDNPILIVASKRDLILKSVKDKKLIMYLYALGKKLNLNIKDIVISSALKKYNVDDILEGIFEYYNHKDVYITGITNVGKSSIVNALLNSVEGSNSNDKITTSNYPGTTLDTIEIPLEDAFLIDTPGIVETSQMIHYVDIKDYKYLTNNKEIKAINFQLNPEQSVYIGGLARFDFISGEKTGFAFYFNNKLKLHRTKLDNADALYDNHLDDNELIPKATSISNIDDFKSYEYTLTDEKVDIVINGLGWISFTGNKQHIKILVPKHVFVSLRKALI